MLACNATVQDTRTAEYSVQWNNLSTQLTNDPTTNDKNISGQRGMKILAWLRLEPPVEEAWGRGTWRWSRPEDWGLTVTQEGHRCLKSQWRSRHFIQLKLQIISWIAHLISLPFHMNGKARFYGICVFHYFPFKHQSYNMDRRSDSWSSMEKRNFRCTKGMRP